MYLPKVSATTTKRRLFIDYSLEPTNEWYAIAKIAGVKACEAIRKQFKKDFVSLMPTNLYGPFDNFDLKSSHVLPAMLRKFHEASQNNDAPVTLWGSGKPMREFLHVDDLAQAVLFALENVLPEYLYNVGTGTDVSIKNLAKIIQATTGHKGDIIWDASKPDGTPRKWMDSSKMHALGWQPTYSLSQGIMQTYAWFNRQLDEQKTIKYF